MERVKFFLRQRVGQHSIFQAMKTVRIRTGARLHFGLLDVKPPYGGIGAMIELPATELVVTPSSHFECNALAHRIEPIAARLAQHLQIEGLPALRVEICQRAPSHHGLGSGTQLALAAAEAMIQATNAGVEPSSIAGRGQRSCVGIHGYRQGGWIDERADLTMDSESIHLIRRRESLPDSWKVIVLIPNESVPIVSGETEDKQFENLPSASADQRLQLESMIDEEIVPAIQAANLDQFGNAVHRYNRLSGSLFASVQPGDYQSTAVADLIDFIRSLGIAGVGQSSWGPGVFVIANPSDLESLAKDTTRRAKILTQTVFKNSGRSLTLQ
jgi:beta-ribofuranosylaminobenzene 5'-phosphate synthase